MILWTNPAWFHEFCSCIICSISKKIGWRRREKSVRKNYPLRLNIEPVAVFRTIFEFRTLAFKKYSAACQKSYVYAKLFVQAAEYFLKVSVRNSASVRNLATGYRYRGARY